MTSQVVDGLEEEHDGPARAISWLLRRLAGNVLGDDVTDELASLIVGALTDVPTRAKATRPLAGGLANDPTHLALIERNTVLAAALGACDCWGERTDCDVCGGAGVAGWIDPDQPAFEMYIAPALRIYERLAWSRAPGPAKPTPARARPETVGQTDAVLLTSKGMS